ncbi:hypothetical protein [Micropruina glycogenica]|uniref:restriction endonuclease subunit S n=1 Tax=Micropruina glycogenica TaxID=75385 RepID=UPI0026B6AF68
MTLVKLVSLGELGVSVLDCEHRTPAAVAAGHPYIAIPDIVGGRVNLESARRISDDDLSSWTRKTLPREGDVIVTRRGRVGDTAPVPPGVACAIGQNLVLLRSSGAAIRQDYLRWATRGPMWWAEVERLMNVGAVFSSLNVSDVARLRIAPHPLKTQRAIAEVLGALDDKITANDRALSVGDSLVRADFAHLSGEPITLQDLVTSVREQVDPTSRPAATPYVGLEHVPRRRMWLQEFGTAKMVASAKSSFQEGDVLFGKLRPYFHKVVRAPSSGIASTDILVLRAKRPELAGLALAAASSDGAVAAATGAADGTRMPRANWSVLKEVLVPWPGETEAVRFSRRVDGVARLAAGLAAETRALGSTRDELLPLLMSGRLHVKDAEKVVAEVV